MAARLHCTDLELPLGKPCELVSAHIDGWNLGVLPPARRGCQSCCMATLPPQTRVAVTADIAPAVGGSRGPVPRQTPWAAQCLHFQFLFLCVTEESQM